MCHGCSFFLLFYSGSFLFIFFFFSFLSFSFFYSVLFSRYYARMAKLLFISIRQDIPAILSVRRNLHKAEKKRERTIKDSSVIFPRSIYFSLSIFRLLSFLLLAVACACFCLFVYVCLHVGEFAIACRSDRTQQSPKLFFSFISPFSKRLK